MPTQVAYRFSAVPHLVAASVAPDANGATWINGVNCAEECEANGTYLNRRFLQEMVNEINNAGPDGLKVRFGHPGMCEDAIGTEIGALFNSRIEELSSGRLAVVADCRLGPKTEMNKAAINHIAKYAKEAPSHIGLSMYAFADEDETEFSEGNTNKAPELKMLKLFSVDFVDHPAATQGGVLAASIPQSTFDRIAVALSHNPGLNVKVREMARKYFGFGNAATPAPVVQSEPVSTPPDDTMTSLQKFALLKVAFAARNVQCAVGTTAAGQRVSFPGDTPVVGDPLVLIDEDGNETGGAPAGVHEVAVDDTGVIYRINTDETGTITEVETLTPAAEAEEVEQAAVETEAPPAALAAKPKPTVRPMAHTPAPVAVNQESHAGRPEARVGKNRQFEKDKADVRRMIALKMNPESKNGKVRSFSADDFIQFQGFLADSESVTQIPLMLQDILSIESIRENLGSIYRVASFDVNFGATQEVKLPSIDARGVTFRAPGCDLPNSEETKLATRVMKITPMKALVELCLDDPESAQIFSGMFFEGDDVPQAYSVWAAALGYQIMYEISRQAMTGVSVASGGTDQIDGLITQILAGGAGAGFTIETITAGSFNPASYTAGPPPINPQEGVREVRDAMSDAFSFRASRDGLSYIIPWGHFKAYTDYVNNRANLGTFATNPSYRRTIAELDIFPLSEVHDSYFTGTPGFLNHIAYLRQNVVFGTSNRVGDNRIDTFFNPATRLFQIGVRAQVGIGIVNPEYIVLGRYAV